MRNSAPSMGFTRPGSTSNGSSPGREVFPDLSEAMPSPKGVRETPKPKQGSGNVSSTSSSSCMSGANRCEAQPRSSAPPSYGDAATGIGRS